MALAYGPKALGCSVVLVGLVAHGNTKGDIDFPFRASQPADQKISVLSGASQTTTGFLASGKFNRCDFYRSVTHAHTQVLVLSVTTSDIHITSDTLIAIFLPCCMIEYLYLVAFHHTSTKFSKQRVWGLTVLNSELIALPCFRKCVVSRCSLVCLTIYRMVLNSIWGGPETLD